MSHPAVRAFVLASVYATALCQAQEAHDSVIQTTDCPSSDGASRMSTLVTSRDSIELQRTRCYGTCPVYAVQIQGNGTVRWHGERFVSVAGDASSQMDAIQAKALIQSAQVRGFASLCGGYSRSVTDNPTVFTTLTIAGQSKRVRDYAGAAPPWLQTLDQEIDRLADTHRWRHGDPKAELFGGARLNEDTYMPKPGVTPLMKAVVQQTPEEIAALLKAGADINAEDASGWTALMYAAQAGKLENLKLVVASGGKAGHRSAAGETALFAAVSSWDDPTGRVKLLKAAGTDINAKDKHGTSALMIAAQHFWIPDLIATMIELGADKTQRDVSGRTAADLLEVQRQQTPDPDHYGAARALLALR